MRGIGEASVSRGGRSGWTAAVGMDTGAAQAHRTERVDGPGYAGSVLGSIVRIDYLRVKIPA